MTYIAVRNHKPKLEIFKSYFTRTGKVSTNKYWEIQSYFYNFYMLELSVHFKWSGYSHAGPTVEIGIFGYYLVCKVYDCRHWDHVANKWSEK
jgi:hypothetical protein